MKCKCPNSYSVTVFGSRNFHPRTLHCTDSVWSCVSIFIPLLHISQHIYLIFHIAYLCSTGSPPLTWFLGSKKNRVKGKTSYRRSSLAQKPENGTFSFPKYNVEMEKNTCQDFLPKYYWYDLILRFYATYKTLIYVWGLNIWKNKTTTTSVQSMCCNSIFTLTCI